MRIEVNGQEYGSVEEMPPDVRRLYEEAVRQLHEQGPGGAGAPARPGEPTVPAQPGEPRSHTTIRTSRRLIVNGQEISSLEELPEELREVVRSALVSEADPKAAKAGEQHIELREPLPAEPEPRERVVLDDRPAVVGARRQPVFAEWMKRDRERRRVSFHVSPVRLAFWIGLLVLIVYLWLKRH